MSDLPSLSTLTVHADDDVNKIPSCLQQEVTDVAPALHVSTTFRYSRDPEELVEAKDVDVSLLCSAF
jgi:cystathionine gamma-synthase